MLANKLSVLSYAVINGVAGDRNVKCVTSLALQGVILANTDRPIPGARQLELTFVQDER